MIIKPNQIDFKKYKRFFTFGCSFTSYIWPTWSEVLSKEMPDAEYYNFGHCGGGNSMISNRIAETNCRYKFTNTDLVMLMWTTFCREDRFKHGAWMSTGNIYTQNEYSAEFIRKHADPKGYLLRDLAFIELTTKYLTTLESDSITMTGVPYNYQMNMADHAKPMVNDILTVYNDTIRITPPSLIDLELEGEFKHGHKYIRAYNGEIYNDYHPHTMNYYNYLKKIGISLTDKSIDYATESMRLLTSTKTEKEIEAMFYSMVSDRNEKLKNIF